MLGALVAPAPAPAGTAAGTAHPPASATLPEEVRSVYDYMPATLLGYIAGAGVICMLFWAAAPPALLVSWLAPFAVMWLARVWVWQRFRRAGAEGRR